MWSRIGTGSAGATVAPIGFAVGALVTARTPIPWSEGASTVPPALGAALGLPPWVLILGALILVAVALARMAPLRVEPRHWRRTVTGLLFGALGVLAWLTGAPAGWHWGLSMTGPARSLADVISGDPSAANWGTLMVVGVPLGTWLSARRQGRVRWRRQPSTDLARRGIGGLLMGAGGTLAADCTSATP